MLYPSTTNMPMTSHFLFPESRRLLNFHIQLSIGHLWTILQSPLSQHAPVSPSSVWLLHVFLALCIHDIWYIHLFNKYLLITNYVLDTGNKI